MGVIFESSAAFSSLDRDGFRRAIESEESAPLLVSFDLEWCGKSRRLQKALEKVESAVPELQVELARVDCGREVRFV